MLRIEVMGTEAAVSREPTRDELARMAALLEDAMQQGYAGFSTDAIPFHYLANSPHTDKRIPRSTPPSASCARCSTWCVGTTACGSARPTPPIASPPSCASS